jgi:hypothetical protein
VTDSNTIRSDSGTSTYWNWALFSVMKAPLKVGLLTATP